MYALLPEDKMKPESIEIEKIVHGGHGLGYLPSGQVILVRNTLPDETVIVTSKEGKKNYLFGRVTEILKENPSRISPPCKFYGVCGGCDLQHSSYAGQLAIKKSILIDLISRGDQSIRHYVNSVKDVLPAPAQE